MANINLLKNETNNSSFILVKTKCLEELFEEVKNLRNELRTILGVQEKLLKKYRDEGLLAYRQVGDKFWYTQSDIDQFLASNYFAAYNVA